MLTPKPVGDSSTIGAVLHAANGIILGKDREIRMALACLLARGHLLIEDVPGVGKTTLAHLLAKLLGLGFQRIQFTSDLLPADILGVSVFDRDSGSFRFHPGPIFSSVILADEVNRATPKAQSALLEAMEERQVTAEGQTRPLPHPFYVIATQNPAHQIGTFPLPESQLDRFLMRQRATKVHAAAALIDYIQALVEHTRHAPGFEAGLSPRASLGLLASARAWALIEGRDHVLPEDIQAVLPAVAGHRLRVGSSSDMAVAIRQLIEAVPIP